MLIIDHSTLFEKQKEIAQAVLIPVPLDKNTLRIKGFNPAQALAEKLAAAWGIPLLNDCLIKTKSFFNQNPAAVAGKKIFLVDIVYGTGEVQEEIARTLKESGAREAWGISVARNKT